MNINCIKREVNLIINSKNKYSNETILYALAVLELIYIIKSTITIPSKFIEYISILKKYINCNINYDFIRYLQKDKHKLYSFINPPNAEDSNSSNSPSRSSSDIGSYISSKSTASMDELVNELLKRDEQVINEIMSDQLDYNHKNKKYKHINGNNYNLSSKDLIKQSKIFFNMIDIDGDGYISANDTIEILKFNRKNPLIFPFDLVGIVIYLLKDGNKIDFNLFILHFV
jgi:hypothetical protein